MAQYAIKELEHLSGIKAHTIRIWEQRYNLLTPRRTETNIRFYSDADLKTLLNVSALTSKGYKISKIAQMSEEDLRKEVLELSAGNATDQLRIDTLLVAMIELDEAKFEKALSIPILQLGFEKAMLQVVYPFLERIGILWQTSNIHPAHEHFVSNYIRRKIIVAIDGQVLQRKETATRLLLFLPEGELHELALLFINYLARARKHHVMYLGQSLPYEDLAEVVNFYKPHYLVSVFTSFPDSDQIQDFIDLLASSFSSTSILLYGSQLHNETLVYPANVTKTLRITDVINLLDKI